MKVFKDSKVDLVIHLGDYVNPKSVRAFKGLKLTGIFGNNDGDKFRLINAFKDIGGEIKGDFYFLVTEGGVDTAGVFHEIPRIDDSRLAEIFAREVLADLVRKELLSPEWAERILSWTFLEPEGKVGYR
ncbi:MAG: metallophosphoesterase family protein [Candidatus Aminicenantes bacterium]|nr:metallophosphoesterase family protein [Candidatus Aminicenantes bacterium]